MSLLEKGKKLIGVAGPLGSGLVLKGLSKIMPGIGSFVSGAYTAGYAADEIIEFLNGKFTPQSQQRNVKNLKGRDEAGIARPDERAELAVSEQRGAPLDALSQLGRLGAQAAGGMSGAAFGAQQQQQIQQMKEAQMLQDQQAQQQQQQAQQQKMQEQQANQQYQRERQLEQDVQQRAYQQRQENRFDAQIRYRLEEQEIRRKEQLSKKESGTKQAAKAKTSGATLKNLAPPPSEYIDALRELDAFINRIP